MNDAFPIHEYSEQRETKHLHWKRGTGQTVFESQFVNLILTQYQREDGRSGDFIKVDCSDWVNICALHTNSLGEECLIMVRQFRHGCEKVALEMPGGFVEHNENRQTAALRELYEETGFKAGRIELIGSSSPNAAFMGNIMHVFLAQDLTTSDSRALDRNEIIDVELVPLSLLERGAVPEFMVNGLMSLAWYYFLIWKARQPTEAT